MSDSSGARAPERRLTLHHDPGAVRDARQFVAALLRDCEAPDEAVARAVLVSSELVGLGDDRVRIEAIDEGRDLGLL